MFSRDKSSRLAQSRAASAYGVRNEANAAFIDNRSSVLQLKKVQTIAGQFEDETYDSWNKPIEKGARMSLIFTPAPSLDKAINKISLVQSVTSNVKIDDQLVRNRLAAFEKRTTKSGTAIDQVLYGRVGLKTKLTNLDPRYAQERTEESGPFRAKGSRVLGEPNAFGVRPMVDTKMWDSVRKGGKLTTAKLKDWPHVTCKRPEAITGGQSFEVAAMAETDSNKYFCGSVRWGYKMVDGKAELDPKELTRENFGEASAEFFRAVAAWNAAEYEEEFGKKGGKTKKAFQLPGPVQSK